MEEYWEKNSDYHDKLHVVDLETLKKILPVEDEITLFDMTSLGTLMLLGKTTAKISESNDTADEDLELNRLSLAYERLHSLPKILLEELSPHVKILDISHNEFENLDFLCDFKELTSLICDHNNITSDTTIPYLPTLELLWMNHCKISELYPWARRLQQSCPNLKYLSLMGNAVAPSYMNGESYFDYLHYRLFIISLFPHLVHLDDTLITEIQRNEAGKLYRRPMIDRFISKTQQNLPVYLRTVSESVAEMFTPTPARQVYQKNSII